MAARCGSAGSSQRPAARRYVLCEVLSEDPRCRQCIEDRAVGLAVRDAVARAHGDYGLGCCCVSFTGSGAGPRGARRGGAGADGCVRPAVKYLNAYTGTVLLRCRKDFQRLLSSALPLVRYLESRGQRFPCALRTLHVGGECGTCGGNGSVRSAAARHLG